MDCIYIGKNLHQLDQLEILWAFQTFPVDVPFLDLQM